MPLFSLHRLYHLSTFFIQNFKPLAIIFCGCTTKFVSDLVGNPKTGFLMTWLICVLKLCNNADLNKVPVIIIVCFNKGFSKHGIWYKILKCLAQQQKFLILTGQKKVKMWFWYPILHVLLFWTPFSDHSYSELNFLWLTVKFNTYPFILPCNKNLQISILTLILVMTILIYKVEF